MNQKVLWIAAATSGAIAIAIAFWARNIYAYTESVRSFAYAMQGYSVPLASQMASADAAAAISTHITVAWVLCGVALVAILGALLRRGRAERAAG